MKNFFLIAIGGAALTLLAGCPGTDPVDAGRVVDGAVPMLDPLSANIEGVGAFTPVPLDMSCFGTRTRPAPGATIPVRFELRDFQDDFAVNDAEIWLFPGNEVFDDCTAPLCTSYTTDTAGNVMVDLPADGWYAYRLLPFMGPTRGETVFGVFQYNEPAPAAAGGSVEGNSVSGTTIELIPALIGITREPGRAIVSGRLEACDGSFLDNVVVRMFDPDGNPVPQGTLMDEPSYHYFNANPDSNLPDQELKDSNADGLYVVVQVPIVDERPYRIEAWANYEGTFQRISCESARIFPDAVTIVNLGPMRADPVPACTL